VATGGDRLRGPQLVHAHPGQADEADLALVAQLGELADLLLERHLGVDAVQLEQRDLLKAQAHRRPDVRPLSTREPGCLFPVEWQASLSQ
jgi:hypothetical protein